MGRVYAIVAVVSIIITATGGIVSWFSWNSGRIDKLTAERNEARIQHESAVAGFEQFAKNVNDEIIDYQSKLALVELEDQKARDRRDATADKFSKHNFEQLLKSNPAALERIINTGTERMRNNLQSASRSARLSGSASGKETESAGGSTATSKTD